MVTNSIFLILGLGGPEIALIVISLLLLFGAKKIPDLARGLGRGYSEFKNAIEDVKETIDKSIEEENK